MNLLHFGVVGAILAAGGLALSIVANSVALLYFTVGICTGTLNPA